MPLLARFLQGVDGLIMYTLSILRMDAPHHIKCFYRELIALYKKYDISISHEDSQGGFIIENYNEHNVDWIMDADIRARVPKIPDELSQLDEEWRAV